MKMVQMDPETAAHNIAKIFCEQQYTEIASKAVKQWKKETVGNPYPGDPDVAIAKALCFAYCCTYDTAYDEAVASNCSVNSLKNSE